MKRALAISTAAHLGFFTVLWQVGHLPARHAVRGYPRFITATLIERPAAAQFSAPKEQPAPASTSLPPETKKTVAAKPTPSTKQRSSSKEKASAEPLQLPTATAPATASPATGSGPGGGPSGGNALKIDTPEFPFPHYLVLVQYRIEINWQPPYRGSGQRVATVYFKISRTGEIAEVKLEQSSGYSILDQAALRAVYSANPLPPLPAGSGLQTLGVHFDFVTN